MGGQYRSEERKGTAKVESQGEGGQLCAQCCRKGGEGKQERALNLCLKTCLLAFMGLGHEGSIHSLNCRGCRVHVR